MEAGQPPAAPKVRSDLRKFCDEYGSVLMDPTQSATVRVLFESGSIPLSWLCLPLTFPETKNVTVLQIIANNHSEVFTDVIQSNAKLFSDAFEKPQGADGDLVLAILRVAKPIAIKILAGELGQEIKNAFAARTLPPSDLWKAMVYSSSSSKSPGIILDLIELSFPNLMMHRQTDQRWSYANQITKLNGLDITKVTEEDVTLGRDNTVSPILRLLVTHWIHAVIQKRHAYHKKHFGSIIMPDMLLKFLTANHGYDHYTRDINGVSVGYDSTPTDTFSTEKKNLLSWIFNPNDNTNIFFQSDDDIVLKSQWIVKFIDSYYWSSEDQIKNLPSDNLKTNFIKSRTDLFRFMFNNVDPMFIQEGTISYCVRTRSNPVPLLHSFASYFLQSKRVEIFWLSACRYFACALKDTRVVPRFVHMAKSIDHVYALFYTGLTRSIGFSTNNSVLEPNLFTISIEGNDDTYRSVFDAFLTTTCYLMGCAIRLNKNVDMQHQNNILKSTLKMASKMIYAVSGFASLGFSKQTRSTFITVSTIQKLDYIKRYYSEEISPVKNRTIEELGMTMMWLVSDCSDHFYSFGLNNSDRFAKSIDSFKNSQIRTSVLVKAVIKRLFWFGTHLKNAVHLRDLIVGTHAISGGRQLHNRFFSPYIMKSNHELYSILFGVKSILISPTETYKVQLNEKFPVNYVDSMDNSFEATSCTQGVSVRLYFGAKYDKRFRVKDTNELFQLEELQNETLEITVSDAARQKDALLNKVCNIVSETGDWTKNLWNLDKVTQTLFNMALSSSYFFAVRKGIYLASYVCTDTFKRLFRIFRLCENRLAKRKQISSLPKELIEKIMWFVLVSSKYDCSYFACGHVESIMWKLYNIQLLSHFENTGLRISKVNLQ